MPAFDGLTVRNILLLGKDGRGTSSLGSPAALPLHTDDEDIIALMAAATRIQKPQEREREQAAPLLEVLYNLPQTLRDGLISWLILPGEVIPSTIIIHQDLTAENLRQLATWRLLHLNLENMTRHRFSPGYLGRLRHSEQAQELAADASLGNSEPIAPYLEEAYPPSAVEPQRTLSCTASIVIKRPAETIFAYLSDPRHLLFEPEDVEGQDEEVKHTYRFFGIPVTLKGRTFHVKETHQLTPDPIGLDTIFEQISTLHGRIHKSKLQIIEYEPPRIIAFTSSPASLRFRIILTPVSGNTILTTTITLGSGCHPLVGFFWTVMVKQDLQHGLKHLKVSLENTEEYWFT